MWSVGISVSPCRDAKRVGYDSSQIDRIVIRMAQYFLARNMRVIFGHDWREDGVMRAVADYASKVASGARGFEHTAEHLRSAQTEVGEMPRMLNVVPTGRRSLSSAALDAERDSGGVLEVISSVEGKERLLQLTTGPDKLPAEAHWEDGASSELTSLRHWITALLNPGCRICLGGKVTGYKGIEPGVMEEARLALSCKKPLYLLGGFGGATRAFGETDAYGSSEYWKAKNGLGERVRQELFDTTDIERALRVISTGIETLKKAT